jgi:carbamoyltransferase
MYILGINSLYHESAACLLQDGVIVAAAEEERFTRVKHAKKPRVDNPDALPLHAMHYCLEEAGIDLGDLDHVAYSSDPRRRVTVWGNWTYDPFPEATWHIHRVPSKLAAMGFAGKFNWVDHHTAHAASAFYASPFQQAAILTIDGLGDGNTTACFQGAGSTLHFLHDARFPQSLGFLWELLSMFLGFDIYDATKIMGLAAYGDADRWARHFAQLVRPLPDGFFALNSDLLRFWLLDYLTPSGYFDGLENLFGIKRRTRDEELTQDHRDIAASLQRTTDVVMLHLVRRLHAWTRLDNLCLAGGIALNCVTNQFAFERGPFTGLFVQPAAHDAGTALGAALYVWHQVLGQERLHGVAHTYLGPTFSRAQIERDLRRHGLKFTPSDAVERDVAQLLAEGCLVGYFQGRMEFGPRALGNRSLLADPRSPEMHTILNQRIKHRESFRPFAPSVLHEEANVWFQIAKETPASEYMLMAYPVRDDLRARIPAVVHVDGTSRIQTVRREANPGYHRLISEFHKLTGVPMVLNTSFNDTEPIVCTPDDAIRTFVSSEIDWLAIGDLLVNRRENCNVRLEASPGRTLAYDRLIPRLHCALDRALVTKRVCCVERIDVITDRTDYMEFDQVLPLFPEHAFFLDEMARDRIRGAHVLEIGIGSGVLSIAAVQAGAERVTALEINPRAKILAGLNVVLNRCEDHIDIRDGSGDIFAPVREQRFDYIMSNPPFIPTPPGATHFVHSAAGPYGMDFLENLVRELDNHLSADGCAQFVTVAPGDSRQPFLLLAVLRKWLTGATRVRTNTETAAFDDAVNWLWQAGLVSEDQARDMKHTAIRDGVSRLYLCLITYRNDGSGTLVFEWATKVYRDWWRPLNSIQVDR